MASIYLIGSLRNPRVPQVAKELRAAGHDVFDDWYAAGPEADDYWQAYEIGRGHNFQEALDGYAAYHVYNFDRFHLDRCSVGVLLLPAGKSGHLELGYMAGQGKETYIVLDRQPDRYDVMYRFARKVVVDVKDILEDLDDKGGSAKAGCMYKEWAASRYANTAESHTCYAPSAPGTYHDSGVLRPFFVG